MAVLPDGARSAGAVRLALSGSHETAKAPWSYAAAHGKRMAAWSEAVKERKEPSLTLRKAQVDPGPRQIARAQFVAAHDPVPMRRVHGLPVKRSQQHL